MSSPTVVKKGAQAVWGTKMHGRGGEAFGGVITRVSKASGSKEHIFEDGDGFDVGTLIYNIGRGVASLEIECKEDSTLPEVGEDITIDGESFFVSSEPEINWQRGGVKNISIKAKKNYD
jgi:hypothetical protein